MNEITTVYKEKMTGFREPGEQWKVEEKKKCREDVILKSRTSGI